MKKTLAFILVFIVAAAMAATPMTVETLLKLHRLSDPQVSPDGKTIVFSVMSPNLEANTRPMRVWAVAIEGGAPRMLKDGANRARLLT